MAVLKAIYDTQDDIPEAFRELFAERDGKFELAEVEGVKTQADVDRLNEALRKERGDHTKTKEKLSAWGDLNPEETRTQLDRIPELEAHQADGDSQEKIEQIVQGRLQTATAPLERKVSTLEKENGELKTSIADFQAKDTRRQIHDAVREAGVSTKILDTAMDDALMLGERIFEVREDDGAIVTRDGVGVTPGIRPADWFSEVQEKRPHWWAQSSGGGAGGGSGGGGGFGENPWSEAHWNVTKQGQVIKEKGMETAERMAKAANSKVGAIAPTKASA